MPRLLLTLGMLTIAWAFSGCSLEQLNPIPAVGPLFVLETQEAKTYERLSREADQLLSGCASNHSCDRAHYLRGLAALYESRTTAAEHFQASAAVGHNTIVASASEFWLQMLKESTPYSGKAPLAQATSQLLRQLLDKEILVRHLMKEAQKEVQKEAQKEVQTVDTTPLKRELQARDKQVEDLTKQLEALKQIDKQLEALKQIDQEMREKTMPSRSSGKTAPSRRRENP